MWFVDIWFYNLSDFSKHVVLDPKPGMSVFAINLWYFDEYYNLSGNIFFYNSCQMFPELIFVGHTRDYEDFILSLRSIYPIYIEYILDMYVEFYLYTCGKGRKAGPNNKSLEQEF